MSAYMVQVSYTAEAWANQIKKPANRVEAIRPMIEQNGAKIVGAWYAFGDYDLILIVEGGNNVTVAASVLVASAGGAVSDIKTTVLMSVDEGMEAIAKAGGLAGTYSPPS